MMSRTSPNCYSQRVLTGRLFSNYASSFSTTKNSLHLVFPVLLILFLHFHTAFSALEILEYTQSKDEVPVHSVRVVSWLPNSQEIPLDVNGTLLSKDEFLSYNHTNMDSAPQRMFVFVEQWNKDEMQFWEIKQNSTLPAAYNRLLGIIIKNPQYNYVCVYTHLDDYYCTKDGCYPPSLSFYNLETAEIISQSVKERALIRISSVESNEWYPFCDYNSPHQIFFITISCLWYSVSIVISILLLIKMIIDGRLRFHFALLIIMIEFAASILRIVGAAIDPYTFKHYIWMNIVHLSVGVITGILVIFVWQDITRRKKTNQGQIFSPKFKTPAIISVIVFSALSLVTVIIPYAIELDVFLFYAVYCIAISITYLILAIFYFVTAARVFKMLEVIAESSKIAKGEASPVDVRAMTIKMILVGVGMILTIIATGSLFFGAVAPNIVGFYLLNFSQGLSSIFTLLVFLNDKKRTSGTDSKQTSEKPTISDTFSEVQIPTKTKN